MFKIEQGTIWMLCVVAAFFLIGLLVKLVQFLRWFVQEKRYLDSEIRRADADERPYWLWKRRRLWLSLLPFVK